MIVIGIEPLLVGAMLMIVYSRIALPYFHEQTVIAPDLSNLAPRDRED